MKLLAKVEGEIQAGVGDSRARHRVYGFACIIKGFEEFSFWVTPFLKPGDYCLARPEFDMDRWRLTEWDSGLAIRGVYSSPEEAAEKGEEFLQEKGKPAFIEARRRWFEEGKAAEVDD